MTYTPAMERGYPDTADTEMHRLLDRCAELAAENHALRTAGAEAAEILREDACALRDCHTVDGEWDGSEPEVQDHYEYMMDVASRLAPNSCGRRNGPIGQYADSVYLVMQNGMLCGSITHLLVIGHDAIRPLRGCQTTRSTFLGTTATSENSIANR